MAGIDVLMIYNTCDIYDVDDGYSRSEKFGADFALQ